MISFKEFLAEGPRIKIIKARVRAGKIQRRVKVSGVKGYSFRRGRLRKITTLERLHRKAGARKAKIKRRSEMRKILIKRMRSMKKRKAIGL